MYVHVYMYVDYYNYYWFIFPWQFSHAQNSSPEPSLRSMPSTASEFTYDSRSPPDSLRYLYPEYLALKVLARIHAHVQPHEIILTILHYSMAHTAAHGHPAGASTAM